MELLHYNLKGNFNSEMVELARKEGGRKWETLTKFVKTNFICVLFFILFSVALTKDVYVIKKIKTKTKNIIHNDNTSLFFFVCLKKQKIKNNSFEYNFSFEICNQRFGGLNETSLSEYVGNILTFLNREENHHLWTEFTEQKQSQLKFNTSHAKGLLNVKCHLCAQTKKNLSKH